MTKLLVLSDAHGNPYALRAVIGSESYDEVLFLGDAVDYGPRPGEVIDVLRSVGARAVMGNHDNALVHGVDCMCGEETHWVSVFFRENYTKRLVSDGDLALIASWPERLELDLGRMGRSLAVHGSPSSPLYGYIYPWLDDDSVKKMLTRSLRLSPPTGGRLDYSLYLVGHTHYQFVRRIGGSLLVNPGSVGQPRDGDPRAAYAVIDTENGEVELKRAKYDASLVVRDLEALGVPEPYMSALKLMFLEARVPSRARGSAN
ncbi:metallophosphoesterase family protein [Acidilobus sp.]|uniref:metallophosphoesterase family protein n=1 Tax=Acidilobus sp. TaxID=1872109 RepID=UPI003D08C45D